jgi:hypothetical protein
LLRQLLGKKGQLRANWKIVSRGLSFSFRTLLWAEETAALLHHAQPVLCFLPPRLTCPFLPLFDSKTQCGIFVFVFAYIILILINKLIFREKFQVCKKLSGKYREFLYVPLTTIFFPWY